MKSTLLLITVFRNAFAFNMLSFKTLTSNERKFSCLEMSLCPCEKTKSALKKMRGVSVSVEFQADAKLSSMDFEILSQGLRKSKVASIWTSDLDAVAMFSKEQETSRGNFPGPCPIIYNGASFENAVKNGATAIVLNAESFEPSDVDLPYESDVIFSVKTVNEARKIAQTYEGAGFLIPADLDFDTINDILAIIPQNSLVIAALSAMQSKNSEISLGKELSLIKSKETGSVINSFLFERACIGDAEDLKYSNFVVESITKKSSSQFKMTGLTGSTNGHFGTSDESPEDAKWRRMSS